MAIKIGLIGVGLNTYWAQFQHLLERLQGYQLEIENRLKSNNVEVVNTGIVDSNEKAIQASNVLIKEKTDILYVYISTYSLSSTILPIIKKINKPVILLNIQPTPSIDYDKINAMKDRGDMTGEWLANCQACSIPEYACVMNKAGIRYDIITGYMDDPYVWNQIEQWTQATTAVVGMHNKNVGILGHYYEGMLDVYSNLPLQSIVFQSHFKLLEMGELKKLRDNVTNDEIHEKVKEFENTFEVVSECEQSELERAAKTSIALDKLIAKHNLSSLAYYYEGLDDAEYQDIITSVIAGNTLLTGKDIPVAGECEVKNVQAMKIMSLLQAGGSFSEFYAMDFKDDVILLGHDGPAHFNIADGKVKLVPVPVYHGKPGKGLSIQMAVKQGPVTLLSIVEKENTLCLLCAEAEAVAGPTLHIGNTNSRYKFNCDIRTFIDNWSKAGPSHHCAIGIGHHAETIKKIAFILDIDYIRIC